MHFDKNKRIEIKNLITQIENKTACELVPMLVLKSNNYHNIHYFFGAILSILSTLVLYFSPFYFINPIYYIMSQVIFFIAGYFLAYIPSIKKMIISKKDLDEEVNLKSYEAFFRHNLHLTENHMGVLIFVSLFERKVKILCDKTVREKIDQKIWDNLILDFKKDASNNDVLNALQIITKNVGEVLSLNFPRSTPKNKSSNEIGDDLIIELK